MMGLITDAKKVLAEFGDGPVQLRIDDDSGGFEALASQMTAYQVDGIVRFTFAFPAEVPTGPRGSGTKIIGGWRLWQISKIERDDYEWRLMLAEPVGRSIWVTPPLFLRDTETATLKFYKKAETQSASAKMIKASVPRGTVEITP